MTIKQDTTVQVPPQLVGFWDTAVGKTLRAAIYLAVSAGIAAIIAGIQNNPLLFGIATPIINALLVMLKNLLDPNVKNI